MIELLFFILKLVGWIVLGILGVILGILLLVLFCAVRYRLDGKKENGFEGKLCVTWLFHIISVRLSYQKGAEAQVKIFGKTVWKLKGENRSKEEQNVQKNENLTSPDAWDVDLENSVPKETFIRDKEKEKSKREILERELREKELGERELQGREFQEKESGERELQGREFQEKESGERELQGREFQEKESGKREFQGREFQEKEIRKKRKKEEKLPKKQQTEIKGILEKLKDRIAAWIEKLRFSFSQICAKLKQMDEKRQWLLKKWNWLEDMIKDPKNQASVRLILRQIKKIFRHVLPRKGSAEVTFGREDPYLMGKLLSYAGAAYPFMHKFLVIHPIFGENCLEGEVHIRGRIRLGIVLGYMFRLLLDKNIRQKFKEVWNGR